MKRILAAACAALGLGSAAWAQDPVPPSPSTLVEEVEVIARLPGPALWRVSTPTAQIWLLAMPPQVPQDFLWDQRRVVKALDGAREFVLPPTASAGVMDVIGLLMDRDHVIHMPPGQTVRSQLPPELRARWEDAARSAGMDPAHYDHWRPVLAAGALFGDAQRHAKFKGAGVLALAIKMHVKVRPLANYKAKDYIRALALTPEQTERTCIARTAEMVPTVQGDTPKLAQAWARGDLDTLRAQRRRSADCVGGIPAIIALNARAAADWAKELKVDLAKPGKMVVGADFDVLTRKGGLLDQLKAEGLDVIGPAY